MRRTRLVAVIAVAASALAGFQPAFADTAAQGARLRFEVDAAGLRVLTIETFFRLAPGGYRIDTLARTVGVAGFFHPGEQFAASFGTWAGNRAMPEQYVSAGRWSGEKRRVVIDYVGGRPVVRERIAPPGQRRVPIAAAKLAGTGNLLSAFAEMIRDTQSTGRCETVVRAYDGRVLSEIASRSAGRFEMREHAFTGPALRCDYNSYLLGGLPADDAGGDDGPVPPLQRGAIWLGQVFPGYPPLPVQMSFATRWFGEVTAHLVSAQPVAAVTAQALPPHS